MHKYLQGLLEVTLLVYSQFQSRRGRGGGRNANSAIPKGKIDMCLISNIREHTLISFQKKWPEFKEQLFVPIESFLVLDL